MKLLIIFSFLFIESNCYLFALPGEKNWPNSSQFLELKNNVAGNVKFRGDSGYDPHTWNRITNTPKPAVIVQPITPQDVIEALKFAKKYNMRLSIQSTGYHQDQRNIYDNSVHIDMSMMTSKSIDINKKTVTVGPGNNFRAIESFVAKETNKSYIVICGGDTGVGIYGWTVGGGHGSLTRTYGLGVDALVSVKIILANYSIVTASEQENPELFRALRGSGGGAFGVTISLTLKIFPDPGVISTFGGLYDLNNETATMFANWVISAPNQAVAYFLPTNFGNKYITVSAYCFGNTTFCTPVLSKLKVGCKPNPSIFVTCEPTYERYQHFFDFFYTDNTDSNGLVYIASTALNASNIVPALQEIVTFIDENPFTICSGNAVLGGVSSTIDLNHEKTSVALEMRKSLMAISCSSVMLDSTPVEDRKYQVKIIEDFSEAILKKYNKWVFWNEPLHNFPQKDWKERYWGGMDNYNRLLAVKQQYDPENFFTCYHCIGYDETYDDHPSLCPENDCSCSNTPNGQCAVVPNIQWGKVIYKCDFDANDTQSTCKSKFTYNSNGQQVGLFQASNTASTQLKYDLTDVTSISTLSSNNNLCRFPFSYNSAANNFCVKVNENYQCMTNQGLSNCNLGKYAGCRTTLPSSKFDITWETTNGILLPRLGQFNLQFYGFYNCYQTKSLLDFFSSDCHDVKDRLTIYTKTSSNDLYSILYQLDLTKKDSKNSWQMYKLAFNATTNIIDIKIKFERINTASKGEALFGMDDITILDQGI